MNLKSLFRRVVLCMMLPVFGCFMPGRAGAQSTMCQTEVSCDSQADSMRVTDQTGNGPNQSFFDQVSSSQVASQTTTDNEHGFYGTGDALDTQGVRYPFSFSSMNVTTGFTVALIQYLTPHATATNHQKLSLSWFAQSSAGGVSVLGFDGTHFSLETRLGGVQGHPWVQSFWDPVMHKPAIGAAQEWYAPDGFYEIFLTYNPDQTVSLDVMAYDASQPRQFRWNEATLDPGWPSIYSATVGSQRVPLGLQNPANIHLGYGQPTDSTANTLFSSEGFTFTTPANYLSRWTVFSAPLNRNQMLAFFNEIVSPAPQFQSYTAIADADMNYYTTLQIITASKSAFDPSLNTGLFPCNTGLFLSNTGSNKPYNTPCQLVQLSFSPATGLLSWNALAGDSYVVSWTSTTGGTSQSSPSQSGTTYAISSANLSPGVSYNFTVQATNTTSNISTPLSNGVDVLAPFTNLIGSGGTGSLSLTMTGPSSDLLNRLSYVVSFDLGNTCTMNPGASTAACTGPAPGTTTMTCSGAPDISCTVSGVYAAHTYTNVSARMFNAVASSPVATAQPFTTSTAPLTGITINSTTLTSVTWTLNDPNIYVPGFVQSYSVIKDLGSWLGFEVSYDYQVSYPDSTSHPASDLCCYTWSWVHSLTAYITSQTILSAVETTFNLGTGSTPVLASVVSVPQGGRGLQVTMNDPTVYPNDAQVYNVTVTGDGTTRNLQSACTPQTQSACQSILVAGVDAGITYTVSVTVTYSNSTSAPVVVTVPETGEDAPSGPSASAITPTGFTVNWTDDNAYASGETPAYLFTLNGAAANCTLNGTTCVFTGLKPGTTYSVGVTAAVNGETASATPITVTTLSVAIVNLASVANVHAFYTNGSTYTTGGLDTGGDSFPYSQLGPNLIANGVPFVPGVANVQDAVSASTFPLPYGAYNTLNLLATGFAGTQSAQRFVVTYTDGTTITFTQSLSDWWSAGSLQTGESLVATSSYITQLNGGTAVQTVHLYGYQFSLDPTRIVQSITLPSNRNVVVMGLSLSGNGVPFNLAPVGNVSNAIVPSAGGSWGGAAGSGGMNGYGQSYASSLLGTTLTWNGSVIAFAPSGTMNGVTGGSVDLPYGQFSTLNVLGAAVNGPQNGQNFVATYANGTTTTFTQSMSDWSISPSAWYLSAPGGENLVKNMVNTYITGLWGVGDPSYVNMNENMYGYSFPLDITKTVQSIQLPSNSNVVLLGMSLLGQSSGPCPPVTGLGTSYQNGAVNVSWTAPTGLPSGANVSYTVAWDTGSVSGVTSTSAFVSASNFPSVRMYTFAVTPVVNGVAGPTSTVTAPAGSLNAPTNLTVTSVTPSAVSLSWTASTSDPNTSNIGYLINYTTSAGPQQITTSATAATITGLASNTNYSFTVSAQDTALHLTGAGSGVVSATTSSRASTNSTTGAPISTVNPSVVNQTTALSTAVSTGGVVPTGTVTFTNTTNGTILGTSPVSTVATTNLLEYSQQLTNTSSWGAYCAADGFSADTANTTDLTAPDGTYTATKFVVPGRVACGSPTAWGAGSLVPTLVAGTTYTVSLWLRGASGGESVMFGLNDCTNTTVTLTTSWTRYVATFPSISSATASCDPGRGMEFVGESAGTFYAWGVQMENASSAGPYIPTTSASTTGYGASLSVSFPAAGSDSIVASYSGSSTVNGSTSPAMTQTVVLPTPSVTETPTSTINPSVYLQPTTLSAMVDTGGVVPNGTVTFTGNGAILGTSPVSTVSTTNLIPYSQQLTNTSSWTAYCAASNNFSADTANTTDLTAPDGTYTSTRFIVPGSGVACGSSTAWGAFSAMSAPVAGNTYTVSMWLRGASGGETVQFGLNDCAKTTVTLTTSWTRYEATFPALSSATASCDGGRMMEFLGLTASTYYAWGAQVETSSGPQMVNANPAGPYVPTTSSSATGYGGTASLSVSFSAPGSNSVVASYSGNSTVSGSTSPAMIQTVFGGGSL